MVIGWWEVVDRVGVVFAMVVERKILYLILAIALVDVAGPSAAAAVVGVGVGRLVQGCSWVGRLWWIGTSVGWAWRLLS